MWLYARWLLALLLRPGGVPQHVAFIMDGNRRYAADRGMQKIQGHTQGYAKMAEAIHWCLELGVQYISVYAFSIDNFARSLEEVTGLMQLAEEKYDELTQESGLAERMGVEVRVIGDLSLAPESVQASSARLMRKTAALPVKHAVLNICFSYSSREEMVHSIDVIREGVQQGVVQQEDVCPQLFLRCLRTQSSPPVELLVRTSGETRLSDFLLWQSAHAQLHWEPSMWPVWSYLSFLRCIISWQQHQAHQQHLVTAAQQRLLCTGHSSASRHQVEHQPVQQAAAAAATAAPGRQVSDTPRGHLIDVSSRAKDGLSRTRAQIEQDGFMWQPPSNWAPHTAPAGIEALKQVFGGVLASSWLSRSTLSSATQLLASAAKQVGAAVAGAAWSSMAIVSKLRSQAVCNGAQAAQEPAMASSDTKGFTLASPWPSSASKAPVLLSQAPAACQQGDSNNSSSCLQSSAAAECNSSGRQAGVQVAIATFAGILPELPCCGVSDASSWTPSTDIASLSMPTSPTDSAPHSPRAAIATPATGVQGATGYHAQEGCTASQEACTAGSCEDNKDRDQVQVHPEPALQKEDDGSSKLVGCQPQPQDLLQGVQQAAQPQQILKHAGCSVRQLEGAVCEVQLLAGCHKAAVSSAAAEREAAVGSTAETGRRARIISLLDRQQRLHDDWIQQHASPAAETGQS